MWLGSIASIPTGWALADGGGTRPNFSQGEYLKGGTTTSDFGTTGGVASHSHAGSGGVSHTHDYSLHAHNTITSGSASTSGVNALGTGSLTASIGHSHTCVIGTSGAGSVAASTSNGAGSASVDPVNTTVAFIVFAGGAGGGLLMASD
jgi:hypothetical protein